MISVIEFVDGPYGKEFFFKAKGFSEKIHSSNYKLPEGISNSERKEYINKCKLMFEKEVSHMIKFKDNPNYEEEEAKLKNQLVKKQLTWKR